MTGRWFRFYASAIRSPKVARLSDKEFRLWVEMLAVASENDGKIPPLDDLKYLLNRRLDHLLSFANRLISIGLIDALADGYEPHNWNKFQYKSDTSTKRVTKHRKERNVSETPPDTETDTDILSSKEERAKPLDPEAEFWKAAKAYLSASSANPGALVGKWCRDHGKPETKAAITAAQVEGAVDPVPYIQRVLNKKKQVEEVGQWI